MNLLRGVIAASAWWHVPILLATLVVALRFSEHFYSSAIGVDYALFMPRLLDGYFWFRNNGISPQWYTPSFCGGMVAYADAQSMYYSVFQLLTIPFGPRHAIFSGVILYAFAGGAGMMYLMRIGFSTSPFAAALGGVLFMSSGFLWARAMAGHLTWVEFMLVPLITALLVRPRLFGTRYFGSVLAGLLLASFVYGGAILAIPPALVAIALLIALSVSWRLDVDWREIFICGAIAGGVALLASASKLVAVLAFVQNFPRTYYLLPGFDSVFSLLGALARSLFTISFAESDEFGRGIMNNSVPIAIREEWDFSISVLPPVFILLAVLANHARSVRRSFVHHDRVKTNAAIVATALLLAPILVNFYSAGWNHFMKSLPISDSMSSLVRFWAVYIPAIIAVSMAMADKAGVFAKVPVKLAMLTLVLLWAGTRDWDGGISLGYDPRGIDQAFLDTKAGRKTPGIENVGVFVDETGNAFSPVGRDDVMAVNVSQLRCYQPQFGYYLERFPVAGLVGGSIYAEKNGFLNMKNPACYTEGAANHCEPGAHFKVSEIGSARALAQFRSYAPSVSLKQRFANLLSLITVLGTLAWLVRAIWRRAR